MGRWTGTALVTASLLALLASGYSDRYVTAVADWYTDTVLRLSAEPDFLLATGSDERAFRECA